MQVFRAPPTWPAPPQGWEPPPGWQPDPSWPPPPPGWRFWTEDNRYVGTVEGPPPPPEAPPVTPGPANAAILGALVVAASAALPYISSDIPLEGGGGVKPVARFVVLGIAAVLLVLAILTRARPGSAGWPRVLLVVSVLLALLGGGLVAGGYHGFDHQDRFGDTAFVHVHPAAGFAGTLAGIAICLVSAYLVTRRLRQVRTAAAERARFARARAFALGEGPAGHF